MPTTETKKVAPTVYYASDAKDKAIDNLWKTTDSVPLFRLVGNKPKKMELKAGNVLVSRATKVQGEVVYFLPKDKDGKLIGAPVRYLKLTRDGSATGDYVLADKVAPNVESSSSFTSLDDRARELDMYGATGLNPMPLPADPTLRPLRNFDGGVDLSNIESLDDSVSNMITKGKTLGMHDYFTGKNPMHDYKNVDGGMTPNFEYSSEFTNESLLDGLTENTSLLNADGGKRLPNLPNLPNRPRPADWKDYKNVDGDYSGLTNESIIQNTGTITNRSLVRDYSNLVNEGLVDDLGTITNRSLITESSNFTNESLLDGLTENTSLLNVEGEQHSNAFGDWFKNVFGKKKLATEKVADPNVAIVDSTTMQEAYKESGSGKKFSEWINSEGGKGVMNSITQLANLFVNRPLAYTPPQNQGGYQGQGNDDRPKEETKILGMSPITFGLVALGVVAIGAIVAVKMIRAKK